MKITGADTESSEATVVELNSHPFFTATLFQPKRSALSGETHSLISGYLKAAKSFQTQGGQSPIKDKRRTAEV